MTNKYRILSSALPFFLYFFLHSAQIDFLKRKKGFFRGLEKKLPDTFGKKAPVTRRL